ncbi:T9SS C-terminal target domain-containing protein [Sphingobacteriales bacterium UPWRP_1]|nr:hypothetical protein B6N25_11900 [Sphingobacteriales bacterium TSM_CSS]PSJ77225.1 T9SS C-terminal target domain-containing protein [Sphingobacteriales bacterium UPWRP_1]
MSIILGFIATKLRTGKQSSAIYFYFWQVIALFSPFNRLSMKPFMWKVNRFLVSFIVFCGLQCSVWGQNFGWSELKDMPEAVSNNAVTAAEVEGVPYVYSFGGIDSTKLYSGIHLRAYRFNTVSNNWESIQPLPDTLGKIAMAASTVKNKIYIAGGYYVLNNGAELSSNKVHIFDPVANNYLPDVAPLPIPVDDHVQAVWRDSLIYVISGWSNNNNVANVQIYNPATNEWTIGTPVPNNTNYKVFGASGVIIGDTIYYAGGAKFGFAFPLVSFFRKGIINPSNPNQITWLGNENPIATGYRMAAGSFENMAFWLGGSIISYNYNGIAYNGSGGVPPLDRMLIYNSSNGNLTPTYGAIPPVMDLRGLAKIAPNRFIIAGGMAAGQKISNKTILLTENDYTGTQNAGHSNSNFSFYPNPANKLLVFESCLPAKIYLYNAGGNCVWEQHVYNHNETDVSALPAGLYTIAIHYPEQTQPQYAKLLIQR